MLDELKDVLFNEFPGFKINSAYDYGKIVVFNLIPLDYTIANLDNMPTNMSFSVNKETKKVEAFLPFDLPAEVYKKGKKVI